MTLALDYLSPLPPVRSGIADYSLDLLPHLVARADVRVLRLDGLPLDEAVARRFGVVDSAARAGEGGRIPLYQMGNNRYHAEVLRLAMERPGVMALHDLVLHHYLLDRTVGQGNWNAYRDELERCHGWIGDAVARPVRWGAFGLAGQFDLPANRTVLARQRGVLVHGRWAAERLAEDDPRLAVREVPMAIPLPAPASREKGSEFRRRHGIPQEAPLLGSFGFQTPMKRTDVAIRALARESLGDAHLLVAGELSPYIRFEKTIAEHGVGARVHLAGFLPFAAMEAAIAATDLCLNLRYPSAGETSASLLRILAEGRPVIVSDYAELGELPPEIALVVPLGEDEEARFAATVGEALGGGRAALAAMGARARAHVAARHAPERAAAAILAAVAELAEREPPGEAPPAVPPRTSVASSRPQGAISVHGLAGWRPGERGALAVELVNRGPGVWLPSADDPGGVQIEVQIHCATSGTVHTPPWLRLQAPLAPGERVTVALEARRPLGAARLMLIPKVAVGGVFAPFGEWSFDRWL
ncbi:MAG TPA: glycosyltransferase [Thermoanaerobaculia bacterium]